MDRDDPRPESTEEAAAALPTEVPADLPLALSDLFQLLATDERGSCCIS